MTAPRPIQVGDRIRDNDPRRGGQELIVRDIVERHGVVRLKANCWGEMGPWHRIREDRVFTDSKPRRTGWSLVTP